MILCTKKPRFSMIELRGLQTSVICLQQVLAGSLLYLFIRSAEDDVDLLHAVRAAPE